MTQSLILLIVGFLCAGGGGELFIRGIVSLATSSRELSVGDAIGNNIVNLGAPHG